MKRVRFLKDEDLKTKDEKEAYTLSDTLIWNIKKLLGKVPGGQSRIASYAAAFVPYQRTTWRL